MGGRVVPGTRPPANSSEAPHFERYLIQPASLDRSRAPLKSRMMESRRSRRHSGLHAKVTWAHEANLMEDPGRKLAASDDVLSFDLAPFEIKTFLQQLRQ